MDPKYDVCFAGEILQGQDRSAVKRNLAKLFNADDATLDRLFNGNTQLLKRGCDRQTALKYKKAIETAGAKPLIRAHSGDSTAPEPSPARAAPPAAKMTAAERIALLAGAPDVTPSGDTVGNSAESAQDAADIDATFDLAHAGADVLRPEERPTPPPIDIDTSTMSLLEPGSDLSEPKDTHTPAPDVSHLSMGDVGDDIPTLPRSQQIVSPDISGISLSPEDSDFSDCAPAAQQEPDLDLSALDIAPSGADMLEETYRKEDDTKAPVTDHLQLED
jgi:hypothetical protein